MRSKSLALILALALILSAMSVAWAEEDEGDVLGRPLYDFTVQTIDGGTFTLSQALQEKGLVFINLWATWCGPCGMEFPYLQEAYEQYQDRVAVIALSVEPTDTAQKLTEYAQSRGLTFPIGNEGSIGLSDYFYVTGIPTSVVVDRFGNVAWVEVGAQSSAASFTALFDWFLSDDYTETRVLDGKPPIKPAVEAASVAALTDALNVPGGSIAFSNDTGAYVWPMVPVEKDGRTAVVSSNQGADDTVAALYATVTAQAGDALAFDFATSTESGCDLLLVTVDGTQVKCFGGEHDWTTWILDLAPGTHEIGYIYSKDEFTGVGEDRVWLDNVRLVSGAEADELRAALPVYPVSEEFGLRVIAPGAKEIVFEGDGAFVLPYYFASTEYWIAPGGAQVEALLPADVDPEAAFFFSDYDGNTLSAWDCLSEDGSRYAFSSGIDTVELSGYPWTEVYLYAGRDQGNCAAMFFADEENAAMFAEMIANDAEDEVTWRYTGQEVPGDGNGLGAFDAEAQISRYSVAFVDQNGDPVPGCIVNFCTDEACTPVVADDNGVASFVGAPYAYHLQVIRVPAGYAFDTAREFYAEAAGGEITLTVTKE